MELGELVGRYETDNRRRGRSALVMGLLGVLVTGAGVPMCVFAFQTSTIGDDAFPSFVLGGGIGLLIMGGWLGSRYFTRSGEVFELYDGGIVHAYGRTRHAFRWDEITKVVNTGKDTALARKLGGNINCQITLKNGRKISITGLTNQAQELVDAVTRAAGQQ